MALNYALVKNKFGEGYTAIAYPSGKSINQEELIDRIADRGSTLTKTDLVAVFNIANEELTKAAEKGETINLPLLNSSFSISGIFDSPMDSFDGTRHKLNLNLTKGMLMREAEKKVKLEKTNTTAPLPNILEVFDFKSGTVNDRLTPDGVVEARGFNLKIEGDDPACGLWFVSENGQEQIKAEIFIENKPAKVTAFIPNLNPGKWQLKLATQFSTGGIVLKTPKTFVYPVNLEVI